MTGGPETAQLLDFIVDRVDTGIFVVDRDMRIILWNQFMAVHSGRSAQEVIGRNLFESFPELPQKWLENKLRSVFVLKNYAFTSWEQRPYLFRFHHNRPVTGGLDYMQQNCTFLPVKDASGQVQSVCVTVFDYTEIAIYQKRLQEAVSRLKESSSRDGLTGIFNRRSFDERLSLEIERAVRYSGCLSLIMVDLDRFKGINDRFGHQAGDEVLRSVAARIASAVRATDMAARYGGEELALILPGTDIHGALTLAERLRVLVADQPVTFGDQSVAVTVSMGVAQFSSDTPSGQDLIRAADRGLYEAKRQGRDRVVCIAAGEGDAPGG